MDYLSFPCFEDHSSSLQAKCKQAVFVVRRPLEQNGKFGLRRRVPDVVCVPYFVIKILIRLNRTANEHPERNMSDLIPTSNLHRNRAARPLPRPGKL